MQKLLAYGADIKFHFNIRVRIYISKDGHQQLVGIASFQSLDCFFSNTTEKEGGNSFSAKLLDKVVVQANQGTFRDMKIKGSNYFHNILFCCERFDVF